MPVRRPTSYNDFAAYICTPATAAAPVMRPRVRRVSLTTASPAVVAAVRGPRMSMPAQTAAKDRLVETTMHVNRTRALGMVPAKTSGMGTMSARMVSAAMPPRKRISPHVAAVVRALETRKAKATPMPQFAAVRTATTATIHNVRKVRDHYGNTRYIYC